MTETEYGPSINLRAFFLFALLGYILYYIWMTFNTVRHIECMVSSRLPFKPVFLTVAETPPETKQPPERVQERPEPTADGDPRATRDAALDT